MGGDTEVTCPGVELDEEQNVEPSKQHCVAAEVVTGQQARGLGSAEVGLGRLGASWTGLDAVAAEDLPDAGRRQFHSQPGQLPVDTPVAPGRVLLGQAEDEGKCGCGGSWSAGASVRVGPVPAHHVPVPAKEGLRSEEELRPTPVGEQARVSPASKAGRRVAALDGLPGDEGRSPQGAAMTTSTARSLPSRRNSRISWVTRRKTR